MKLITQSLIKNRIEYLRGECGTYIEGVYHGEVKFPPSDAMRLGIYFEYLVTGGLPRSKEIPEPDRTAKGKLTAPYEVVTSQAERTKTYMKRLGIKVVELMPWKDNGYIGGHFDAICEAKWAGQFVLDLKYSGLVSNKWEEGGWVMTDFQTRHHAIQATHYHIITGLPFFYLVAESKQGGEIKLINMDISETAIQEHATKVAETAEFQEAIEMRALEPRPDITRCESCPLYENCEHRAIVPKVQIIKI